MCGMACSRACAHQPHPEIAAPGSQKCMWSTVQGVALTARWGISTWPMEGGVILPAEVESPLEWSSTHAAVTCEVAPLGGR